MAKDNIKRFAKAEAKGKKNWAKYLATNNEKFKEKAKKNFAERDACAIVLSNPAPITKTTNFTYQNNKSKTTKILSENKTKVNVKKQKKE